MLAEIFEVESLDVSGYCFLHFFNPRSSNVPGRVLSRRDPSESTIAIVVLKL